MPSLFSNRGHTAIFYGSVVSEFGSGSFFYIYRRESVANGQDVVLDPVVVFAIVFQWEDFS